jgi:hypothetical protein
LPDDESRNYCQVEKGLTYSCRGLNLKVGDTVELPPTHWMNGPWRAKVIALGRGNYDGPTASVTRKIAANQLRSEEAQHKRAERLGLRRHKHKVKWSVDSDSNPRSPYESISLTLGCGCELTWDNLSGFGADMGWDVRGMGGKSTPGGTKDPLKMSYRLDVRRRTLQ